MSARSEPGSAGGSAPSYDVDLYRDDVLADPYPYYREMRDLGPIVWLPRNAMYAMARYHDIREALRNYRLFSSAEGVGGSETTNKGSKGTMISSDPPDHTAIRQIVGAPMLPGALTAIRPRIEELAEQLVERLVAQQTFDAVTDLAQFLPLNVVSEMVGLPEDGRQNMLKWAAATFDILGGENHRYTAALPSIQEMRHYTAHDATRERVKPGSWIARLYEASDRGDFPAARCPILMRDYLAPSLDTTIFAMANAIWLFTQFPDQWDRVVAEPALIPNAVNEAIRLESPIRGFTRQLTAPLTIEQTTIPQGARVALFYASGNRDERKWDRADAFDVTRKVSDHLGYGHGIHTCAGMHLARLELHSVLTVLARRVRRIELLSAVREVNNVLRGFGSIQVRVHQ